MLDARIGLISTPRMLKLAQKVAAHMGIDFVGRVDNVDRTKDIVTDLMEQGVCCVIARGRTADIISEEGRVSLVNIVPKIYDVVTALSKTPKTVKRVVLILYQPRQSYQDAFTERTIKDLEEVTGLSITLLRYRSKTEVESLIQKNKGSWFVGTRVVVWAAKDLNQNVTELASGEETFRDIFNEAINVLETRRLSLEETTRLNQVIDIAKQGVITLDSRGVITAVNSHASTIISDQNLTIGAGTDYFPPAVKESLEKGEDLVEEVMVLNGKNILLNQRILRLKEDVIGAVITIQDAHQIERLDSKIKKEIARKGLVARWTFDHILGNSKDIEQAKKKALLYSRRDFNILITGETGTGKEMFAHAIHLAGNKKEGPFVAINCSALPESLLESELFGYDSGAFTGARRQGKPGLFELAHDGTIFLDEINNMNYDIQSRLLRAIEEKQVMRIGSDRLISVDARVIAASNQNLWHEVKRKKFREDLYFRLNELELTVPPLRNRLEDIPILAGTFLSRYGYRGSKKGDILKLLKEYPCSWPGNVRQLENFVKRAIVLMDAVPSGSLLNEIAPADGDIQENTLSIPLGTLEDMEKELIRKIGSLFHYDIKKMAGVLDVDSTTVWRRLKKARPEGS